MITDNKRELTQTVNGQTTSFEYDNMGRQTKVTAPGNVVTNTTYYPTGEVKRVDGATYPVEYTYNGLGMQATLKTFKDADTPQVTSWSYNNRGQMTAKTYADNSSVTYTYNGDGQLLTRTWARDIVATYTYDAAGRMTGLSYSDNTPSIAVTYNFLDQPVTITDAAGTRTLTYNAQSRLENETIPGIMDNMVNSYSYDAYGRLILRQLTTTGTAQAVSGIAYDVKGRVASVGNGADTLHYAYRPGLDRLATATWRNSQNAELNSRTYAYDTYHRLTGINLNNVSEVTYTLNAKDQRTAASYAVGGAWSYSYDEKSQVTGATGNNTTYSYTYDGIGNRLTAAENSNTWSYTSNLLNQYTAINSNQPTYDADGNMLTTGDGWLYTWNGENRLIRAENSDTLVEMAYDYMGRRIEKKVSSKGVLSFYSWSLEKHYKFAYDGYKLIAIYDAANNNALLMTFTWQPQSVGLDVPVSMTCDGNTYYYVTDGNKNVTGLLDQAGTRVAEYVYGPFGQLLSAEGELADVNPFRFSSEYADDETGLIYYNYRYYSPQLGRWTKRDPIEEEGGENLYGIVNNSIVNLFDFNGLWEEIKSQSDSEPERRIYRRTSMKDTKKQLANKIGLDATEFDKWAIILKTQRQEPCEVSVPNVIYIIDLTSMPIWNSWQWGEERVVRKEGYKVVEVDDPTADELKKIFLRENIFGLIIIAHGDSDFKGSIIGADSRRVDFKSVRTKYKLGVLKLIACYTKTQESDWGSLVAPHGYFYPGNSGRLFTYEAIFLHHGTTNAKYRK